MLLLSLIKGKGGQIYFPGVMTLQYYGPPGMLPSLRVSLERLPSAVSGSACSARRLVVVQGSPSGQDRSDDAWRWLSRLWPRPGIARR